MIRRPPRSTRTDTLFPYTTLFRSLPVGQLADISNSGTLFAFFMVAIAVLVLRVKDPHRHRPFRTPVVWVTAPLAIVGRSEEHTSELQSLMRISYAVFCLKKKNTILQ